MLLRLFLTLLTLTFARSALAAPLHPGNELALLPTASVLCISTPGVNTVQEIFAGRCLGQVARLPAEVWYRFELAAGEGEALLIATDVYTVKGGALTVWNKISNGDSSSLRGPQVVTSADPMSRRAVRDGRLALAIPRDRSLETLVVARLSLRDGRHLNNPQNLLQLATREAWESEQSTRSFGQGLFFGLLGIMVIYNAFLFYAERHVASGMYALLLVTAVLYFAILRNIGPRFIWSEMPELTQLIYPAVGPLLCASALAFVRAYAGLNPKEDRTLRLATFVCLASAPLSAVIDRWGSVALAATQANIIIATSTLILLGSCAAAARRGNRPALVLLLSFVGPAIGVFAQIGVLQGLLRPSPFFSATLQVGNALQITILGIAIADRMRQLRTDRDRADAVLHQALPAKIAARLKAGETPIADRHAEVAVLFADLAGFTQLSARRRPEEVVQLLDALFSEFDQLAVRHGAEKIKTIGDCYMAVAGAPHAHPDPAAALADLALEMPAATDRALARIRKSGDQVPEGMALRVGVHLGPVVAGVLGQQKLAYDMWGDTVNTASRMESHGVVGRIQCTEAVYERLRERYDLKLRGEIEVRGKGTVKTWFLLGRRA